MIDLVYIVGPGSKWRDNELRYSLRSVEKYMKNFWRLIIVGHCPKFITPDILVPYQDMYKNKARNISEKILVACTDAGTDKFVYMNDDYFLNNFVDAENIPYFYKNTIDEAIKKNAHSSYLWHLTETKNLLLKNSKPLKNFDTHAPMIVESQKAKEIILSQDWSVKNGYVFKSLYCNMLNIEGVQHQDCKMNYQRTDKQIMEMIKGKDFFSVGEQGINKSIERVLANLYPQKSKYETDSFNHPRI